MLTNCFGSFTLIVLVKISGYTRNILCYVSAGDNRKIKPAYGAKNTQGSPIRMQSSSMSELPGCKQQ